MVHNTAFETRFLNTCFAHLLGFECFRGAKWFWCFHWTHHRFTNDPSKDPELSGESVDLDDPTKSLSGYLQFISGYPFGFERVVRMARTVCYNDVDPWVVDKPETTQRVVRMEAACYLFGYSCVFLVSLLRPTIGIKVVLLWMLPHCIGAGHLRLYQFAEHRACKMGPYTASRCFRETSFFCFVSLFFPEPKEVFWRFLEAQGFHFGAKPRTPMLGFVQGLLPPGGCTKSWPGTCLTMSSTMPGQMYLSTSFKLRTSSWRTQVHATARAQHWRAEIDWWTQKRVISGTKPSMFGLT